MLSPHLEKNRFFPISSCDGKSPKTATVQRRETFLITIPNTNRQNDFHHGEPLYVHAKGYCGSFIEIFSVNRSPISISLVSLLYFLTLLIKIILSSTVQSSSGLTELDSPEESPNHFTEEMGRLLNCLALTAIKNVFLAAQVGL